MTETLDLQASLQALVGAHQLNEATTYFQHVLLKELEKVHGDFQDGGVRECAAIGKKVLGDAQADPVIAECVKAIPDMRI